MSAKSEPHDGTARNAPNRLEVHNIARTYPGVTALDNFSLSLRAGEVRALLGKNGAGKSTLVRILSGAEQPDAGTIWIDGVRSTIPNPAAARSLGIATVHQELSLVPELSVAENMLLGRWRAANSRGPFLSVSGMNEYARNVLNKLQVSVDPRTKVRNLSVAAQQTIEIARAVSLGSKILILDEPTSSLPSTEVNVILDLVRRLAEGGISIIYVSHRMDEIPLVAHSVTVVRDGRLVDTRPIAEANTDQIVQMMTGGTIYKHERPALAKTGDRVLAVNGLRSGDLLTDVSLDLHAGEILGVAGLLGSGRSELLRCLFGIQPIDAGQITLNGRAFAPKTPIQAIAAGMGFTPEERKRDGLSLGMSVSASLVMAVLPRISRFGFLSSSAEKRMAIDSSRRLAVKAASLQTVVGTLSGGNQQKVILGKWLNAKSRILLLDEPTRGVDIEAKGQIYELIGELASEGVSVLVVSSEIEELFLVCDRLIVLNGGEVVAQKEIGDTTPAEVMAIAMEGKK